MAYFYVVVSATVKGRCMRGEKINRFSNINPETFHYEEEEEIVNCFPSLEMAQWVQKQAGEQKMTSIIGLEVLDENIIRGNVHGNMVGKVHIAKRLEEQLGKGNHYRYFAFPGGNGSYLVLHGLENIVRVFADPTPKPRMVKRIACEPLNGGPVEKKDTPPPRPVEPPKSIMPPPRPVEPPRIGTPWPVPAVGNSQPLQDTAQWEKWWFAFLIGAVAGLMLGLVLSGLAERHPFIAGIVFLTELLAAVFAIIYYFTTK